MAEFILDTNKQRDYLIISRIVKFSDFQKFQVLCDISLFFEFLYAFPLGNFVAAPACS